MPLFRITKKLTKVLRVKLQTSAVEPESVDHQWFADLFFVEGKKCVIWVHRTTLFAFVRPLVTAAELAEFPALFRYEFRTAVASMALSESLFERFNVYGDASYAPTNDRRVVGSMLDYRNMFEVMVGVDGGLARADIRGINAQLNESPMSVLRMASALGLLRESAGSATRH